MDGIRCYIRKAEERDWDRLEEIYLSQQVTALPEGYFPEFQQTIRDPDIHFLVAEANGRVVGGGGVVTHSPGRLVGLTFGTVHASECGKGFGTDLLLARLASIPIEGAECQVLVVATQWSANFFRRLGFVWHHVYQDERGYAYAEGSQLVTPANQVSARRLLENRLVALESSWLQQDKVPEAAADARDRF